MILFLAEARAEYDAHLDYLASYDEHVAGAFEDRVGDVLGYIEAGVSLGTEAELPTGERVRRVYIRPLLFFYGRQGEDVLVYRVRHDARGA